MTNVGRIQLLAASEYILHADRQIDQIVRRVLQGEKIPSAEKVYSLYEPHTEWINKGKAGVLVEYRFILHHHVMPHQSDVDITVEMARVTRQHFPNLESMSYDRGFYSHKNRELLKEILPTFALPKKGKLSNTDRLLQQSESYQTAKTKHSAVESAINGLTHTGLDKCPDHGIEGFRRYVALSMVARNIERIGAILQNKANRRDVLRRRRIRKRLVMAA